MATHCKPCFHSNRKIHENGDSMFGFLKKLFAGDDTPAAPVGVATVEYEGYRIVAAPRKEPEGFRIAGRIEKDVDGETKVHPFVRADVYHDLDATADMVVHKAKRMIDEQGDRIFER